MQSLVFLAYLFSKVIKEKPLRGLARHPGKGRVKTTFQNDELSYRDYEKMILISNVMFRNFL